MRWRAALVAVAMVVAGCGSTGSGGNDEVVPAGAEPSPDSGSGIEAGLDERAARFESIDATFTLAGTLSVPPGNGPHPGVVLVSGAGSQDRDGMIGNSQPQRDVAEGLARHGFVVLRFDDRGVGRSGGEPIETTDATTVDVADDVEAAVQFLAEQPEVDQGRIGVIGHSMGGVAATMVANRTETVAFLVLLASPGVDGAKLVKRQTADILRAEGAPSEIVDWTVAWRREVIEVALSDRTPTDAEAAIRQIVESAYADAPLGAISGDPTSEIERFVGIGASSWFRFDMAYDPAPALQDLQIPVLAVFGSLDVQASPDVNETPTRAALAGNADATIVVLDGLNHLFQPAITGAPSEYNTLNEPFATNAISRIADWISAST